MLKQVKYLVVALCLLENALIYASQFHNKKFIKLKPSI